MPEEQPGFAASLERLKAVTAALVEAKKEFKPIKLNKKNPHYNSDYADLSEIQAAVTPALTAHGCVLTYEKQKHEHCIETTAILIHAASGGTLKSSSQMPVTKATPHEVMSATTYSIRDATRLLLALSSEGDDDGNAANEAAKKAPERKRDKPTGKRSEPQQSPDDPAHFVVTGTVESAEEKKGGKGPAYRAKIGSDWYSVWSESVGAELATHIGAEVEVTYKTRDGWRTLVSFKLPGEPDAPVPQSDQVPSVEHDVIITECEMKGKWLKATTAKGNFYATDNTTLIAELQRMMAAKSPRDITSHQNAQGRAIVDSISPLSGEVPF
jgi:hypothetical protein